MTDHLDDSTIHDLVDGALDGAAQARATAHTGDCADCHDRVARVHELRNALAALRRDIDPPRGLLAEIHAAIAADSDPAAARPRRSWAARPALLAAAAVLLVAATAAITTLALHRSAAPPTAVEPERTGTARLVAAHPLEPSWQDAIAELQRELAAQGNVLAPDTRRVIEANLEIIDRALAEARAALLADPANAALAEVLRSGYERKLDVLRSAAEYVRPAS